MKFIGKIVGGVLGLFATRNPIGCGVGIALGHAWDAGWLTPLLPGAGPRGAFLDPLFGLAGAVAKADGRVTPAEIASVEKLMRRLDLDEPKRQTAIRAFNDGKESAFDVGDAARRLRIFSGFRSEMKLMVIEVLAEVGAADGHLHMAGDGMLSRIAQDLGIDPDMATSILHARRPPGSTWTGQGDARREPPPRSAAPPPRSAPVLDPYQVLGVSRLSSESVIRNAYRKQITKHHPDKMQAQGIAGDALKRAEDKAQAINAAWEQIKVQRGFN
ncbi:MAG: co-chaperone DjlA [Lysobacterales bacterium]